jgi:hypothetical protein
MERSASLVKEFLLSPDGSGISIYSHDVLQFIPTVVFGGAFSRGEKFVVSAGELLAQFTAAELALALHHRSTCDERLSGNDELTKRTFGPFVEPTWER